MIGFFLGSFAGLVAPVQEIFCSALAALVGPVRNIFFPSPYTILINLSSSPSKLGRQPCWLTCLVVCVSGIYHYTVFLKSHPSHSIFFAQYTQKKMSLVKNGACISTLK